MPNNSFRYILAAIIAVLTIALSVSAQNQAKHSRDEAALISLVEQMSEAQSKFDFAALEKIYVSDFIETHRLGEVNPLSAYSSKKARARRSDFRLHGI